MAHYLFQTTASAGNGWEGSTVLGPVPDLVLQVLGRPTDGDPVVGHVALSIAMAASFTPAQLAYLDAHQDDSRVGAIRCAYIVPMPIMLLATGLRLYVKKTGRNGIALDDYLIVFATICALGVCISGLVGGPPHGFGRHITAVAPAELIIFLKGDYIFSHFYDIALGSVKLAILAFYHRIFPIPIFRRVVLASATFVVLWTLAITIVLALQCRPIEHFWNVTRPGTCFNLVAFSYFTNISNLVTDIWIFLLPVPVILRLHVSMSKRLALIGVFGIGLGVCIISAVRLSVVVAQGSPDITWDDVPVGALSAWEPLGGILCANLPIIYPFFAQSFQRLKTLPSSATGPSKHLSSASPARHPHDDDGENSMDRWRQLSSDESSMPPTRPPEAATAAGSVRTLIEADPVRLSDEEKGGGAVDLPAGSIMIEREFRYQVEGELGREKP